MCLLAVYAYWKYIHETTRFIQYYSVHKQNFEVSMSNTNIVMMIM